MKELDRNTAGGTQGKHKGSGGGSLVQEKSKAAKKGRVIDKTCTFWAKGECERGESCRFVHELGHGGVAFETDQENSDDEASSGRQTI